MTEQGHIYIAGPMTGYPNFNAPAFDEAEAKLAGLGFEVFNPASHDRKVYGEDFFNRNPNGDPSEAAKQGFSLRAALSEDLAWICLHATHIAMLPGWERSFGAQAEHATAVALKLTIIYIQGADKWRDVLNGGDVDNVRTGFPDLNSFILDRSWDTFIVWWREEGNRLLDAWLLFNEGSEDVDDR